MSDEAEVDVTRWYTGPEVAAMFGVTPQYIGKLREAGRLTGVQRGRGWFYSSETIEEYRRSREKQDN